MLSYVNNIAQQYKQGTDMALEKLVFDVVTLYCPLRVPSTV